MAKRQSVLVFVGCSIVATLGGCTPKPPTSEPIRRAASEKGGPGVADDPALGARFAELGTCALDGGGVIEKCRVAYRTFGQLDAKRANVVLFPTWFTGTTKTLEGIVPDKLVDTRRFFLVLVDSLGNGVSSSPSNSETQPRLRFPRFTIHDMVEAQRRLLREVLGVERLHAACGISMGGMQAFEWAVSHPDEVDRIVPIVGSPQLATQDLLLWNAELHLLDDSRAFAGGGYVGRPKIPALQELHWSMLSTPAHRNKETNRADYEAWAKTIGDDAKFDWTDWHRQLEAMIAHDVARADGGDLSRAARRVKARGLVVVAEHDHMVNPEPAKVFAREMKANLFVTDTPCGHMAPGCVPELPAKIRAFLEE